MERLKNIGWARGLWLSGLLFVLTPCAGYGADAASTGAAQSSGLPSGAAPGGQGLAVEEVVRIALENQSSVKSAAFKTKAQDAVLHQQMAAYYPTVTFNNFYRTNNTGGRFGNAATAFDTLSSVASMNMTLYNFGIREGTVQSARDTLDATQYSYNVTANDAVLTAKQAYYGVLRANALLNVNEETVKDREATLKQTQSFYDVGTRPRSDVTQAEANLYLAQADLITARNDVEVAWANLRNAMGVDNYPQQPLADQLSTEAFPMSLNQAKEAAFAAHPDLLRLDASLKAQDQQIAVNRRGHLPELSLNSSYGRQAAHSELFPLNPTWLVQLSLNFPIFNGFKTTYQIQEAMATYDSIKEQLRLQKQQVALQVEQNYLRLMAARDVVRANEAAVKAAKQNLDLHEARYQVGYAPIVEVTTAQATYTTAQTNYVIALVSYKLFQAQLINAIGRQ